VTNRRMLVVLVLGILAVSLVAALLAQHEGAPGSALSPTARGWLGTRRYAEARGIRVTLMDREDHPLASEDVLWIVFPWQQLTWQEPARQAREHLRRGGTLVIGYSGQERTPQESEFLDELGVARQQRHEEKPPLHPFRWREQRRAEWRLVPAHDDDRLAAAGRIRRTEWLPAWPATTDPWLRNEGNEILAGEIRHGGGRLILLPSELLCNARLDVPGNADILEKLVQHTPSRWVFDEFHHGLSLTPTSGEAQPTRAFELWMAHLLLVYLLAVLTLARRFGPGWSDPPVSTGSARAFFLRIGALHARLGHWGEAATLLHSRARELDPGIALPAHPGAGASLETFLRFARRLARAQQQRRK